MKIKLKMCHKIMKDTKYYMIDKYYICPEEALKDKSLKSISIKPFTSLKRNRKAEKNNKYIYILNKDYTTETHFINHCLLLFFKNRNWFQKEENIRYLINMILIIIGLYLGFIK